jgi:hypothetical protein
MVLKSCCNVHNPYEDLNRIALKLKKDLEVELEK